MALKSYILIGFHHIFKNQNIINIYMLQNLTPIFVSAAAAAPKLLQSCPTLCDPIDGSPSGSPVPGILQARTLEWVAISFSNAGKWKVKVKSLSRVRLLVTPWTAAYQAPPSMGFSRQEYWSGVPLPSPILCLPTLFSSIVDARELLLYSSCMTYCAYNRYRFMYLPPSIRC